jgi:ribose 5-phosphate isomerase B
VQHLVEDHEVHVERRHLLPVERGVDADGAALAANKMAGIRAGLCHDTYSAHQCVEHDDVNLLALGARIIGPELAIELVRAFLGAKFSGEERHLRWVNKIMAIERSEASRKQGA